MPLSTNHGTLSLQISVSSQNLEPDNRTGGVRLSLGTKFRHKISRERGKKRDAFQHGKLL